MLQWKALRLSAPLYALSAEHPKPFTVHVEQFVFWHLAPLQLPLYHSQGKPLIFYIVHSHACFFPRLWEELFSITSFVPKWMSASCMWLCLATRETSRNFQKRNGKNHHHWSIVLILMAGLSSCLTFFAELSLKAASQEQAEGKAELQAQSFLRTGPLCHSRFISSSSGVIVLSMHVE